MNIVLMGAPGAGKGTQADLMKARWQLPHVASGDLFREHIKNDTELGKQVKAILARGDLVPDDVTIAMIRQRMSQPDCAQGILLDGFPRTVQQAEALGKLFVERSNRVDHVVFVQVAESALLKRLSGRWFCKVCQTPYHIEYNPPKVAGVCDRDGGELIQRPDDKVAVVANRLTKYFNDTLPVIEYYRQQGVLREVDGAQDIEQVYADVVKVIGL
jgi:adenylate kinase